MSDNSVGSVCSGYGGLDMALRIALGDIEEAWFCEIEAGPSLVLAERFPGVKNYGDMTAVDWRKVERPRIVTAGFPCQGNSVAGKRLGRLDPRWLWPAVEQCVNTLRPEEIFAENVANLLRVDGGEAFGDILADLHALGYDVRWVVVGACAAGLSHHRHRVFIRATLASKRRPRRRPNVIAEHVPALGSWWTPTGPEYGLKWPAAGAMIDGRVYADEPIPCGAPPRRASKLRPTPRARDWKGAETAAARAERIERGTAHAGYDLPTAVTLLPTPRASDGAKGGPNQRGSKGDLALPSAVMRMLLTPRASDVGTPGRRAGEGYRPPLSQVVLDKYEHRFAEYWSAIARQIATVSVEPPEPTEPNKNGAARLAPAFPEWMMTLPAGWVTDVLDRVPALKAVGNGVAPVQATLAYRLLACIPVGLIAAA